MTQGRQRLELCRETLVAIRRQQADITALTALSPRTAEEELAIADQLRRSRALLAEIRRLWPVRLAMAMQVLDGVQGMEYKCLWCYYVLGLSNREVSQRLQYDYREVVRRKTEGLEKLEERTEKSC